MEMQQLRHFWVVAQHRNLVRAAQALNLTQPALSRSIKALEAQLEVKLFDRTPRGVNLTTFGSEFLQHVRVILNERQRAILSINALRSGRKGHINVGVGHSFASYLLPRATAELFGANPGISMRVREGYYEELVRLLRIGEIDLVLSLLPDPDMPVDDLVVKPLIEMRSSVIANAHHPLREKSIVTLKDLSAAKWLLQDQTHATRSFLEMFEQHDLAPPAVVIKTTSMPFLGGMLRVSDFLALVGDQLLSTDLEQGTLVALKTALSPRMRHAGAIYRALGTVPPAVHMLIKKLQAICKKHA